MKKTGFKFKYASELAGLFVILAASVVLVSLFLAAGYKGWMEGKLTLRAAFADQEGKPAVREGAFGLQEGNEVRVMDSVAGRVARIMPDEDGRITATLTIRNRFRQFVRKDSTAKVRRQFGIAGDAHLEIGMGSGAPIEDGDVIICTKDEEIMVTIQKALKDVQEVVLPLIEQVRQILGHVNVILERVEKGDGLAGAVVNDSELALDLKRTVKNANAALVESRGTLKETTRVMQAVQKTWPFRRHVPPDSGLELAPPVKLSAAEFSELSDVYRARLGVARASNSRPGIARNCYNLGVCLIGEGHFDQVRLLLEELKMESSGSDENAFVARLLEAELALRQNLPQAALKTIESAKSMRRRTFSNDAKLRCHLLAADVRCALGENDQARSELDEAGYFARRTESLPFKAEFENMWGRVLSAEGKAPEAAARFERGAGLLGQAGAHFAMAGSLGSAAAAYEKAGDGSAAAERYFRAGRSLVYTGNAEAAKPLLDRGRALAARSGDERLAAQFELLVERANVPN